MKPSDVLLSVDIMVELCGAEREKEYEVKSALEFACRNDIRIWIYTASIQKIYEILTEKLIEKGFDSKEAPHISKEKIRKAIENFQLLSSIGCDLVFSEKCPHDPLTSQMIEAVKRLGKDAKILIPDGSPRSIAKESDLFLRFSEFSQLLRKEKKNPCSFVDLRAQQYEIAQELEKGIFSVLRHGQYVMGPEITELEKALSDYVNVSHCITCSSGTDGLIMGMMALGIGAGDAVFTTPFTFIATAEAIRLVGATPVFVDIDENTFLMSIDKLERAIYALKTLDRNIHPLPSNVEHLKAKAIISVDLFGNLLDYSQLTEIATSHNLFLIEDGAQAFGSRLNNKKACSFGDIACTSFFPAKPLGCYGDGGALFTESGELACRLRSIRNHGMGKDRYEHVRTGLNGRMDTLQAAVLLAKLKIFDKEVSRRNEVARLYKDELSHLGSIRFQDVLDGVSSVWAQFSILLPDVFYRNKLRSALRKENIPFGIYYPVPLHLQPVFSDLGYKKGDFPVSEKCAERIIALPMHPYLKDDLIKKIANIVSSVFEK